MKSEMLEKTLLIRDPEAAIHERKKWIAKNKVKTSDLYDEIRTKRTMPSVPLHRMDEISRNLAEKLLNRTAEERVPYKDWQH